MRKVQVSASRDELLGQYRETVRLNPLLAQIAGECKVGGWTDLEIRTMQLLAAVKSNESLQRRLTEIEAGLSKVS